MSDVLRRSATQDHRANDIFFSTQPPLHPPAAGHGQGSKCTNSNKAVAWLSLDVPKIIHRSTPHNAVELQEV